MHSSHLISIIKCHHHLLQVTISLQRHFLISVVVRFGWNSVEDGFDLFFFSSSFVPVIPSQCNCNRYSNWIGRSINSSPIRNWATRMLLPLPMYSWFTMPIFQYPQFFSFPLINTMSSTLILNVLSLCYRLYFSLRATRYLCFHLFDKAYLHRLIYLCRFFIVSLSLSWGAASGKFTSRPRIRLFEVRIE